MTWNARRTLVSGERVSPAHVNRLGAELDSLVQELHALKHKAGSDDLVAFETLQVVVEGFQTQLDALERETKALRLENQQLRQNLVKLELRFAKTFLPAWSADPEDTDWRNN